MKMNRPQGIRIRDRVETDAPTPLMAGVLLPWKWEHRQVSADESADLGSYVSEGWELVAVVHSNNLPGKIIAYFKRHLR